MSGGFFLRGAPTAITNHMFLRRRQPGFTMLELAVTISVVVLLLTLTSISYRRANKRTELIMAAQQVASTMRLAESYAASAKEFENNQNYNIWGLQLDKTDGHKLVMFVDKNKDGAYDPATERYKDILLPQQVKIANIYYSDGNKYCLTGGNQCQSSNDCLSGDSCEAYRLLAGNETVAVTFVPPNPKVRFCQGGSGNCGSAAEDNIAWNEPWDSIRLVLTDELNNSVKDINVNFFGLIDVR